MSFDSECELRLPLKFNSWISYCFRIKVGGSWFQGQSNQGYKNHIKGKQLPLQMTATSHCLLQLPLIVHTDCQQIGGSCHAGLRTTVKSKAWSPGENRAYWNYWLLRQLHKIDFKLFYSEAVTSTYYIVHLMVKQWKINRLEIENCLKWTGLKLSKD